MRRLPPLNAVHTFEAAARHLSFHRAAEELHVTPSAVSHQVRTLEEFLGVRLFNRLARQGGPGLFAAYSRRAGPDP
jgi:LysR family glycine cleavage system transcriptional activator